MDGGKGAGLGGGQGEREKDVIPGIGGGGKLQDGRGWLASGGGSCTGVNGCNGVAKGAVTREGEVWEGNGFGLIFNDLTSEAWKCVEGSGYGVDVSDVVKS
jgi:hypothetical protein